MNKQNNIDSHSLFHGSLVTTSRILYTPSGFARSSLLYLQEAGSLTATKPHTSRRQNLSSFLFFIVKSGEGTLSYQGKKQPLHAGDCVFLNCRFPYSHTTSQNLWDLQWVHFNGRSMNEIFEKYIERGGLPVFHPSRLEDFTAQLDKLYQVAGSDDYIRDMRLNEEISRLLSLIMEQSWNPSHTGFHSNKSQIASRIRSTLEQRYNEKISLAELAKEIGYNKYYVIRIFRDQYGTTIGDYLQQIRIAEAKRLLRFSNRTIEEIGATVGLPDANYFSRVFRKIEGISPSAYRKSW